MDNFQGASVKQGQWFEQTARLALEMAGFSIAGEHVLTDAGVEVDLVVVNQYGVEFWVFCNGSLRGDRPGARRTDTLKKAIADIFLANSVGHNRILLMTSHCPTTGRGRQMLETANEHLPFEVINPLQDCKPLEWLARLQPS